MSPRDPGCSIEPNGDGGDGDDGGVGGVGDLPDTTLCVAGAQER